MRVKLKTNLAGPEGCFAAGSIADLDRDTALGLIKDGYAEAADAGGSNSTHLGRLAAELVALEARLEALTREERDELRRGTR